MLTVLDKNTEVVLAYLEKAKNVCVSEKINGEYILTFWLPRSDPKWQYIETENYVRCEGQLFIVRTTEEERDAAGRLTANVQCEHVYTELIDEYQDQLLNFAGTSAEFALTQILQGTRFTIGTVDDFGLNDLFDLGETNKLDCTEQVKDTWGGEFKWDNRECNLLTERGADNGVQFRYAKNLKSIKRTVDSKNLITRLYGYGRDGLTIEGLDTSAWTQDEKDRLLVGVTVDGSGIITSKYIDSQYINNYPIPKCGKKEFNDISDQKTLLEKMQDYMAANEVPKVTYEVDFIELKKLGYKFEDVALGDTVTAIDEPLQANIKARIYEYEYYPYEAERSKVRLANFRENITDLLGEFQDSKDLVDRWKSSTGKVSSSMLEGAINVLINQLIASGAYASAQVVDGKGCLFENTKIDSPDYGALYIGPGIFAIADEKVDGNWNWRTFGKGSGFTADQLIAGKILTSLVRIEGSTHFYWDGDTLYCIDPADANRQIRINKDGITFTVDGGTTVNVAINYDGLNITSLGSEGDTVWINAERVRVSHADGTYTEISADGHKRYVAGEGKDYFYLYTTARVSTVGTDTRLEAPWVADETEVLTIVPPVTITLPSDYQNKDFKIFVEARWNQHNIDIHYRQYVRPAAYDVHIYLVKNWVVEAYDIDYVNATFKIKAYSWTKLRDPYNSEDIEYVDGLDLVYTVTA